MALEESSAKLLRDFPDSLDRADEDVKSALLCPLDELDVVLRADVQASEQGRQVFGDASAFSGCDAATGPVDQFQVVIEVCGQCEFVFWVLVLALHHHRPLLHLFFFFVLYHHLLI